jgi:quinoprotein glucose dehydrogenase
VADFVNEDPKLCALDKASGKRFGEVPLPANVTGAPMTYMLNGKQYVVFPTGGSNLPADLVALSLP